MCACAGEGASQERLSGLAQNSWPAVQRGETRHGCLQCGEDSLHGASVLPSTDPVLPARLGSSGFQAGQRGRIGSEKCHLMEKPVEDRHGFVCLQGGGRAEVQ